jgi:hypothetical protein
MWSRPLQPDFFVLIDGVTNALACSFAPSFVPSSLERTPLLLLTAAIQREPWEKRAVSGAADRPANRRTAWRATVFAR